MVKKSSVTVSSLAGALAGIYTYLGLHLLGLRDPYFVAKYTYTIAGAKVPYFSRMINSLALALLAGIIVFVFTRQKGVKDLRIFNVILLILLALAGLLSYLYQ